MIGALNFLNPKSLAILLGVMALIGVAWVANDHFNEFSRLKQAEIDLSIEVQSKNAEISSLTIRAEALAAATVIAEKFAEEQRNRIQALSEARVGIKELSDTAPASEVHQRALDAIRARRGD